MAAADIFPRLEATRWAWIFRRLSWRLLRRSALYGGGGYYAADITAARIYGRGYYGGRDIMPRLRIGIIWRFDGYAAPACNPPGFYDQYGNWQV